MLGLLDAIEPRTTGIFYDKSRVVMGGYTVDELLDMNPDHYIVKRLLSLNKKISRNGSKIGLSHASLFKIFISEYSDCLRYITKGRLKLNEGIGRRSYYFRCSLVNTKLIPICQAYQKGIDRSLTWYRKQGGTSAKSLPLGRRIRLPDIDSGLYGLGLQKE